MPREKPIGSPRYERKPRPLQAPDSERGRTSKNVPIDWIDGQARLGRTVEQILADIGLRDPADAYEIKKRVERRHAKISQETEGTANSMSSPSGENLAAKIARYQQDIEDIDAHIAAVGQMSEDGLFGEGQMEAEQAKWAGIRDMIEELLGQLQAATGD
jgi:hypothetical protein